MQLRPFFDKLWVVQRIENAMKATMKQLFVFLPGSFGLAVYQLGSRRNDG